MVDCPETEACKQPFTEIKIDSPRISLVNDFKLYCHRKYLKNESIFLTICLGGVFYFIFSFLSDRLGRRLILRAGILVGAAGMTFLLFSNNLAVSVFGLVLLCLTADNCYSLSFIYMAEISPPRLRNLSSLAMILCYFIGEMTGAFAGLLFRDYRMLATIYFILCIPMFLFFFTLRHTFHFLQNKGKAKHFLKLLSHICYENKVPIPYVKARLHHNKVLFFSNISDEPLSQPPISTFQENNNLIVVSGTGNQGSSFHPNVLARKMRLSISDLDPLFLPIGPELQEKNNKDGTKQKKGAVLCFSIFAYSLLVMNLYWVMGLTLFLPEKMGLQSLYLNTFLLALADFFGVGLMAFFLNNTNRSKLNSVHLLIIIASSSALVVLDFSSLSSFKIFQYLDVLLSCKFIIFLFVNFFRIISL